ncbi:hypothetical protein L9W92_12895 [Pelotomaculum terephthalicicum JT]|uniref:TolB family protein n=1 Tax=Pelotomaculum TaxID=191373 RepID=UPI0009CAC7C8|nr:MULTISPECIES: hypothetical protein [Pelotomaculum]MCG9968932.1 hypothetical protein [Pelotomaculum terephthalicicum JT]OPX86847.1 MAG: translocation protein TolB [Pelotomaculum sp. PtaB.Bin117]
MFSRTLARAILLFLALAVFLSGCEDGGPGENDLAGGVRVMLKPLENLPVFPGRLAVISQGDLWVLESGKEPLQLTGDGCSHCPAWSPDGQWLLFFKYDPAEKWNRHYSLWVARADGGGIYSIEPEKQVLDARWSPAANSIAYLTAKQGESVGSGECKLAAVTDKGPGAPLALADASEKIMSFCWQPTGEKLVYTRAEEHPNAKENLTIKVTPVSGGETKTLLDVAPEFLPDAGTAPAYLGGLTFSPNNIDFSFFSYPFSASLTADGVPLYATTMMGNDPKQLATALAYPDWVDWSPGGDCLAFIEGGGRESFFNKRLSVVPINRPEKAAMLTPEGYVDRDPAWSPKGDFIAVSRSESSRVISDRREEWPPSSIWLASPDGAGARQISSGEVPGCLDCSPWWVEGGESLMWVRLQGEKASIWQAGADGKNAGKVFEELDVPQGYYGAYKWDEVLAWHPGGLYHPLPFPSEQAGEIRSVGDNYVLIDRTTYGDHNYYLDHPSSDGMKLIVGFIETAEFKEYKDGELIFRARGGSDTGYFQFPYLLIYNPVKEELRNEELFLPLNEQEQVSFGKRTWKQVITNFAIEDPVIHFDFKPAPGEVLAGGHPLPETTVQYSEENNELVFSFFNVEFADTFQDNTHFASPGLKFAKEFNFEQLPGRPGDEQTPSQPPVVRARISLEGSPQYNAAISYFGGIGYDRTVRCTVNFQ